MNKSLRLWIQLVATLGLLVILQSLVSLYTTPQRYEWLFFAALAILTGSFSMKIGSVYASVTIADTFFITTALLFGPAPATLAIALGYLRRLVAPRPRSLARRLQHGDDVIGYLGREPRLLPAGGRASAGPDAGAGKRGPGDRPTVGAHRHVFPDQLGIDCRCHRPRCAPLARSPYGASTFSGCR